MKTISRLVFLVGLILAPLCVHASIGQVNNLNASGSAVIYIPGPDDQLIVIQNNGSNSVRLSFDGGAGYYVKQGGKQGTNPTPTTGYLLAAGQQVTISTVPYVSSSLPNLHKPIVAIMVTSTTTLDIISDGVLGSFPST
jgi:hypothetical protein